ncbi:MAG: 6-carboxytetrahydropterin synthase [Myxococcales bacterium]|nr:6-carboxytetrahydropterin synthase [Myxococcales bacterium]
MFTVCVRDHVMIAHSFRGEVFGPAQRLHGATYVIDVEFRRPALDPHGLVVDIGRASAALAEITARYAYRNLDEIPELQGLNTTTEVLAKLVFDAMKAKIEAGEVGPGSDGLHSLRVTLHESHVAWASYEAEL